MTLPNIAGKGDRTDLTAMRSNLKNFVLKHLNRTSSTR
jgi:hypothetical protein